MEFHIFVWNVIQCLLTWLQITARLMGRPSSLMRLIRNLLDRSWHVEIHYSWREAGNRSVGWLANFSLTMDSWDFVVLETPLSELNSLLFNDISGACMSRNVRLVVFLLSFCPLLYQKKKALFSIDFFFIQNLYRVFFFYGYT